MPHHIDLYAIYQLDRRQPPEALAAALTTALNATDPRDTLTCNRIDTARAILGDPQRRARYDAALADPNAPTLDEAALAAIADVVGARWPVSGFTVTTDPLRTVLSAVDDPQDWVAVTSRRWDRWICRRAGIRVVQAAGARRNR